MNINHISNNFENIRAELREIKEFWITYGAGWDLRWNGQFLGALLKKRAWQIFQYQFMDFQEGGDDHFKGEGRMVLSSFFTRGNINLKSLKLKPYAVIFATVK